MNQQKKKIKSTNINWPANAIAYINELEAKLAGANINAARYLWLRDRADYSLGPVQMVFMCATEMNIGWTDSLTSSDLDEKIDNQIKKGIKNV